MNNQSNSNYHNQNKNSALGQVFNQSGKIAILLIILAMLAMGIGAMVLMGDASVEQDTIIEFRPDGFRLENRNEVPDVDAVHTTRVSCFTRRSLLVQ